MLNVLLITLGLAWLTELAGLSLALGAFLAGMLISETEYRYQVEEDIKPFRDVLLGLFFITIGMRLDVPRSLRSGWLVARPARHCCWPQARRGRHRLAPARRRAGHGACAAACGCAPAASSASSDRPHR
jgi:hypothetical protein